MEQRLCLPCTTHPESADAIFLAAQKRNMCLVAGKNAMDRTHQRHY